MSNKKLLLIVNPCSGRAKMRTELLKVVEILSDAEYEVTVYPTKDRGDATLKAAAIAEGEYDLLVVCGGDGTLNEVITGLMQTGIKQTLGYIPSGTLNEWSSGLGIARNIADAAKDITAGHEITLDVGQFGDKYFSYTASFGAFTSASYSAPQDIKNVLGQAAYFFEGIKSLGNIKPMHLKFICDEKEIEGDFLFGAVSNSMSVGGIVKFDDSVVKLNDGYFEVLLIKNPDNILKLQPLIDGILRKELDREGMEFFHTKSITVIGGEEISWTLDGEYAEGKNEIKIENIHNAITLIVPDK
ncbi:MAG: diacylglycerol kinase family protein [Acutalibacteraceae bacterium]|nr:diacylglycerol kinase family protein [Acutalibacteraceae bacterium]